MSKAALIRELYDGVLTTAEIAEIVGCDPGYVRVAARQRIGGGTSDIDRRYNELNSAAIKRRLDAWNATFQERYHGDAVFREKHKARCREYYHTVVKHRQRTGTSD